ncbi:hypothetical protein EV383_3520 [Pseudonocardia sediminis]|uniref:Uncharacterized protein n=1 Tax=Pseudonocardia sediminis TaxID=1397368 RepID=A0A4Q7V1Y7_PSEST|nr:hypothetical protein [Pseudonocardia sediminis]RZT86623.1 hypothetical protein EV383_3520 [Pseudonocardia sediminis]
MIGYRRIAQTVPAPGVYDDGPVFLRVNRRAAGARWPVPGFEREVNDHELENDATYDWVRVPQNSRAAFVYLDRLVQEFRVPLRAVAVVRFRRSEAGRD